MTTEALDIHQSMLNEQLGENSSLTQLAYFDPTGSNKEIYGIFEKYTSRMNKDGANVYQKIAKALFQVASIEDFGTFNDYYEKQLYLTYEDKTFKIDYISKDETGTQIIWLS